MNDPRRQPDVFIAGAVQAGPPGARPYRTVTRVAVGAIILILLEVMGEVLSTSSDWRTYLVVHQYQAQAATRADLDAADDFSTLVSVPVAVMVLAAAVVFLVWLRRARINSGPLRRHRYSPGWAIGGWFIPVANLWIPYQVVSDVWQASTPQRPAPSGVLNAWWTTLLIGGFISQTVSRLSVAKDPTEQSLLLIASLSTGEHGLRRSGRCPGRTDHQMGHRVADRLCHRRPACFLSAAVVEQCCAEFPAHAQLRPHKAVQACVGESRHVSMSTRQRDANVQRRGTELDLPLF